MISCFCSGDIQFFYYANLVIDDVTGCASTVVRHKIKNISANNEAMLLKFGRDVAPYEIYQMVHILMLLWQHARFQSPASYKSNTVEPRLATTPSIRPPRYYGHFILARKKAWSVIFLFKEPL